MKYDFGPEQICVPLTRGKFATVDVGDLPLICSLKWYAKFSRGTWYAAHKPRSAKAITMHRLISGATGNEMVDHRNGNGLINRRHNLRIGSSTQNSGNRKTSGKFGFKGVVKHPYQNTYAAEIRVCGKTKRVWRCPTIVDAALSYDDLAREHFGKFACVNFPRPGERSALTGEIMPLEERVSA